MAGCAPQDASQLEALAVRNSKHADFNGGSESPPSLPGRLPALPARCGEGDTVRWRATSATRVGGAPAQRGGLSEAPQTLSMGRRRSQARPGAHMKNYVLVGGAVLW